MDINETHMDEPRDMEDIENTIHEMQMLIRHMKNISLDTMGREEHEVTSELRKSLHEMESLMTILDLEL